MASPVGTIACLPGASTSGELFGNGGQQVETCGMRALIGRQGQAFAMRQLADVDSDWRAHEIFSAASAKFLAMWSISSTAT